jgi:thiamine-monophosphate kinase
MTALSKEQKLIAKIKTMVGASGRFIGDDCAVLPDRLLATTDTLVEHIHFEINWTTLKDLGWKAMAVNLSDIAAMAGIPKYALIVLSAPKELYKTEKIISLYEGIIACAQEYKTAIVGGDITAAPNLSITVTVIGQAHQNGVLMRSSAKPGDIVIASGNFGASNAGLRILQSSLLKDNKDEYKYCLEEFFTPSPKLKEAWLLAEKVGARGALMDTSDGLADALLQIAKASDVGMNINSEKIPIHEQTRNAAQQLQVDPLKLALYGGEDYQLVACLPEQNWLSWKNESQDLQKLFTQIGIVNDSGNVQLMFGNDKPCALDPQQIFQHIS